MKLCRIFSIFVVLHLFYLKIVEGTITTRIVFVILSQPNAYHNSLAELRRKDIFSQAKSLNSTIKVHVYKSHGRDFKKVIGHWTVFPLFEKLSTIVNVDWVFFLSEKTNVDLGKLVDVLAAYDSSDDVFAGFALKDLEPTIIHHFDSAEGESAIHYPHFSAGFFFSQPLIKRLGKKYNDSQFNIDPQYELAKLVWEEAKVKLTNSSSLCLERYDGDEKGRCATWFDRKLPDCGKPVSSDKVFLAVKTFHKYHKDRVEVVKKTWGSEAENILFFSDILDETVPTVALAVENVKSGHCEKTFEIMRHYIKKDIPFEWLVIVDDDTLISIPRLKKLLACYQPLDAIAIGERYGYGASSELGYAYLTGGSGMVFSRKTVEEIVKSCFCPSANSPDDMIIGLCLSSFSIPVTHSPYFHQARPSDYSPHFLGPREQHVSFHKHWMIDPVATYRDWLQNG